MSTDVFFVSGAQSNALIAILSESMIAHVKRSSRTVYVLNHSMNTWNKALTLKTKETYPAAAAAWEKKQLEILNRVPSVIAEISFPCAAVGRVIEYARTKHVVSTHETKVLCLYHASNLENINPMFLGMSHGYPNVTVRGYTTEEEVHSVITKFLEGRL